MLTIEQLRSLPDLRAKFQATTGLTWDPTELDDEKLLKAIQWLFPKGAGFDAEHIAFDKEVIEEIGGDASDEYYNQEGGEGGGEEPTPEPEPDDNDNTQQAIGDNINNPDNTTTVTTGDDQGNTNTEPLDLNSTVEPVTVDDGDDNPDNNPAIGTSDGEIIVTGDENDEP